MAVVTDMQDKSGDAGNKFKPCFSTNQIWLVAIIRHFLESRSILYVFTGEDLLPLSGGAIAFNDAAAILHLQEKDIPEFMAFIEDKD